ncbi:hypothetical protein J6590_013115 [Homalodisca vitripennis]|nr:hypothetical protein J6590_013115 [Homalodisca vitripennis]
MPSGTEQLAAWECVVVKVGRHAHNLRLTLALRGSIAAYGKHHSAVPLFGRHSSHWDWHIWKHLRLRMCFTITEVHKRSVSRVFIGRNGSVRSPRHGVRIAVRSGNGNRAERRGGTDRPRSLECQGFRKRAEISHVGSSYYYTDLTKIKSKRTFYSTQDFQQLMVWSRISIFVWVSPKQPECRECVVHRCSGQLLLLPPPPLPATLPASERERKSGLHYKTGSSRVAMPRPRRCGRKPIKWEHFRVLCPASQDTYAR